MKAGACYWRFKGEKAFVYGYASYVSGGLYRNGRPRDRAEWREARAAIEKAEGRGDYDE